MNQHSLLQVQTIYFADGTSMSTSSSAGMQGAMGPRGFQGDTGTQGAQGSGAQGATGAQGDTGPRGFQGDLGAQGAQGSGAQGASGAQGDTGPRGFQGDIGAQGAQGPAGASATDFWAYVTQTTPAYGIINVPVQTAYIYPELCITNNLVSTSGTRLQGTFLNYSNVPNGLPELYQGYLYSADIGARFSDMVINAVYDTATVGATGARLGVNTNVPQYTIDVNGSGNFNGTVYATQFLSSSDHRLKQRVRRLGRHRTIDRLRPVEYEWKADGRRAIGLIAHEVQRDFPELVHGEKDGAETQRVDTSGLVAVMVGELQRLKREVRRLRSRRSFQLRKPSL